MILRGFERRLERMVEGVFARTFRSAVRPLEIGRRLVRSMDDRRSIGVRGETLVPNHFTVRLGPTDMDALSDMSASLCAELADAARDHARESGYGFPGPVVVELEADASRRTGTFEVEARLKEGPSRAVGSLVLPGQRRVVLGDEVVVVGRLPECAVQLNDPNVSRRHAEIRPSGDGFVLIDLGSTNGCRVNGQRISRHPLVDGDEIVCGATSFRFQAS